MPFKMFRASEELMLLMRQNRLPLGSTSSYGLDRHASPIWKKPFSMHPFFQDFNLNMTIVIFNLIERFINTLVGPSGIVDINRIDISEHLLFDLFYYY